MEKWQKIGVNGKFSLFYDTTYLIFYYLCGDKVKKEEK